MVENVYKFIIKILNLFPNKVYEKEDLILDAIYYRYYPPLDPQKFVFKGLTKKGEIKVLYFDKRYGFHEFTPKGFFGKKVCGSKERDHAKRIYI